MTETGNETTRNDRRTLSVAGAVALICALAVTAAHVTLSPRIAEHRDAERQARMAAMLQAIPGLSDLLGEAGAAALEPRRIVLATGADATGDALGFDALAAAQDPETSRALPPDEDIAGIGRIADDGVVYLVWDEHGALRLVILPIHAQGYQSVIRGLLAIESDLRSVAALNIVEQGETPGLGARIQTPQWQGLWPGRQVVDDTGALAIAVVRGRAAAAHEVDGLTGATRSAQAVGFAARFWLGPAGYGPFLERLAQEEGSR
ncbi:hypothetical protein AN191_16735 [Loktanella sp. 5RATIMAR09]|uniref:Na+-translocating NADH-quinone reductase subunit C n=1 Tax=Loktanella sp. 5RATIMAR09 TaxID=1225655 RepID=UPI0006EBB52A|nr:Na+-translocating NADH-quinone reductase subunit C [Loktanella sp. 5RATIMAR09]KQI70707.1 hypothetical protein AN191_16735 [Loktanella sp. 5RATIMAR09]